MDSRFHALHARAQWALYTCALLAGNGEAADDFRHDAEESAEESGRCSHREKSDMPMFLSDVSALSLQWEFGKETEEESEVELEHSAARFSADLIRWIDSHNPAEPTIDNGDGTLTVACACVNVNTGASFVEHSTIPATLKAARDWLGY
ncbi:hypothetical protein [Burkholderia lata]|nr:hypothetical protein [Burkholderia lata]